jgi:hypothetical protein
VTRTLDDSREVEAILRRMEQIRRGLDEDVQDIVEGARELRNWRYYVKAYPWICLGAAVAGGYFIVPRRRAGWRIAKAINDNAGTNGELPAQVKSAPARSKSTIGGTVLALVGSMVLRTVVSHAVRKVDELYASYANGVPKEGTTHESSIRRANSSRR